MGLVDVVQRQLEEVVAQLRLVPPVTDATDATMLSLPGELIQLRIEPDLSGGVPLALPIDLPIETPATSVVNASTSTASHLIGTGLLPRVDVRWSVSDLAKWEPPATPTTPGRPGIPGSRVTSFESDLEVFDPSLSSVLRARPSHYTSPTGLTDRVLALRLVPPLERFQGELVGSLVRVEVRAHVTVSATVPDVDVISVAPGGRHVEATASLGPFTIVVPSVPVPTVLLMARDRNLRGPALIVVPREPEVRAIADLFALLQKASDALEPVRTLGHVADFLTGIDLLTQVLANEPHLAFARADTIDNLNEIDLVHNAWWKSLNDTEVEDEISSLLFLGPPAAAVDLFVQRNQRPDRGHLTLRPGTPWFALIRDLHHISHPVVEPSSARAIVHQESINVIVDLSGRTHTSTDSFADEFSSLAFSRR